jgi:hypothetical protein
MKAAIVQTSTRRMRVHVGDILEGVEGKQTTRLEIMYLGRSYYEPLVIARKLPSRYEGPWTLSCRDWRRVKT